MKAASIKFPKRFEMEGVDPLALKVKVVGESGVQIFDNVQAMLDELGSTDGLCGPMADKYQDKRCVRFETSYMNDRLSC
jgi:hypothetical protein